MRHLLNAGESDHASTSQVVLTKRSTQKFYRTALKVFFCTWEESRQWQIKLDLGTDWDWRCDYANKEIVIARRRYKNRDLLRSVLIQQIAWAQKPNSTLEEWIVELDRARYIALNLGRDEIAEYLSQTLVRAQMGRLDIQFDNTADTVTTRVPSQSTRNVASIDDVSPDFEDSLHISFVNRHIDQAVSKVSRIKSPKALLQTAFRRGA